MKPFWVHMSQVVKEPAPDLQQYLTKSNIIFVGLPVDETVTRVISTAKIYATKAVP